MLRIHNIVLQLTERESLLPDLLAEALQIKSKMLLSWQIYKKSIDARKKQQLQFVYSLDFSVANEAALLKKHKNILSYAETETSLPITKLAKPLVPPVVVGTGPAGLFAALKLAEAGLCPIVLERGAAVEKRKIAVQTFWRSGEFDASSNVQFGEGGAGTFSDGKLTTQIKNPLCRVVLQDFVKSGAPAEILYTAKPHIGTDKLLLTVAKLRQRIISLGGEVRFEEQVVDLSCSDGQVKELIIKKKLGELYSLPVEQVVLAIGHSARDTYTMLNTRKIRMEAKAFAIGVRIEHLQATINASQYGALAGHAALGAAEYKLAYHDANGRSAYSFCMCPGGVVVASASEAGGIVTNGMSYFARNGRNANSAMLVNVGPEDFQSLDPLAGIEFQRKWEEKAFLLGGSNYKAPVQTVADFFAGKATSAWGNIEPSYLPGVAGADLHQCLPTYVTDTLKAGLQDFAKKIAGFAAPEAILTGVETRSSAPLRIFRDTNSLESNILGIYPCGEGAGYAGGIMSAAVDGIRCALAIIEKNA
ncbi:MAG: FAD-binding protein [Clostridia bacterium]